MNSPVANAIKARLATLNPDYLACDNESAQHAHYQANAETHIKLTIVSAAFAGLSRVRRHQIIYQHLNPLLTHSGGSIHALAIHAFTPEQWQARAQKSPDSPPCAGRR